MDISQRRAGRAWLARTAVFGLLLFASGCGETYPQSTLVPHSDITRMIDSVFRTTFWWAMVVFVLVEAALLFAMWRFRAKPNDPEPVQSHGNTTLEVIWTIIPAMILVAIAVPTVKTIMKTSLPAENPEVEVEVIGHQWWWEFRYPKLGVVTANEMVVPVGKMVGLRMWSADVLHSFWSPQLASKRDVFPIFNGVTKYPKVNPLWFTADTTGDFSGQCAELCGIQHGRMGLRVQVLTQEAFDAWVAQQRVGSPLVEAGKVDAATDSVWKADPVHTRGQAAFMAGGCLSCHAMVGTPLAGATTLRGPNLSHLGSRTTIGANMYENTPANLAAWLRDPQGMKKGSHMILPRPLTEAEVEALVAYLRMHK
ncbi:MAG: cytochrome c oxidase subunit II [Gemmatimonadales bacterium]